MLICNNIKKLYLKVVSVAFVFILIVSASFCQFAADTYFKLNDFLFSPNTDYGASIYGYEGESGNVTIPYELASYPITKISKNAFLDNKKITSVTFEKATELYKIEEFAFNSCTNLTSVVLSPSITEISLCAFQSCTSLSSLKFNASLTVIPQQAFYNCVSLDNVVLPDTVESIGKFAFGNCSSLTSITIPKTTTDIADNAFLNSPNLIIKGYFDSYAEEYALANDIPFEPIVNYALGDVDKDGDVTIYDVTLIQKALAGIYSFGKEEDYLADVKRDGSVTIDDATTIQKYLADLIPAFE